MTCKDALTSFKSLSNFASENKFLIFSSLCPTNLFIISGPLTIFGSLSVIILPIFLANKVLPHPGGPYNKIPFTCFIPKFSTIDGFTALVLNALLNTPINSLFNPPIPISSKL